MPYCSKCGEELPQGAKFCPKCGAKLLSKNSTGFLDEWRRKREERRKKMGDWLHEKIGQRLRGTPHALREQISDLRTWRNVGYLGGVLGAIFLFSLGIYLATITKEEPFGIAILVTHPFWELGVFLFLLGVAVFFVGFITGKYYSWQRNRALDKLEEMTKRK